MSSANLTGTVHGNAIELDQPSGLTEGQRVTVEVRPVISGEGIRDSAGAWSGADEDLDRWLQQVYEARHANRSIPSA